MARGGIEHEHRRVVDDRSPEIVADGAITVDVVALEKLVDDERDAAAADRDLEVVLPWNRGQQGLIHLRRAVKGTQEVEFRVRGVVHGRGTGRRLGGVVEVERVLPGRHIHGLREREQAAVDLQPPAPIG